MNSINLISKQLSSHYNSVNKVIELKQISKGFGNENYMVKTSTTPYFLKIIAPSQYQHLPRQTSFYANIHRAGLQTIAPITNTDGSFVTEIGSDKIMLFPFEPLTEPEISTKIAAEIGQLVAKLHTTAIDPKELAESWDSRERCLGLIAQLDRQTAQKYQEYLPYIESIHDLPKGFVFNDVCADNLYAKDDRLLGFIDPENAGYGEFIFDIAGAMIMCFFTKSNKYELCRLFLAGYEKKRRLTQAEKGKLFAALIYMCARLSLYFELKPPPVNTERINLRLGFANELLKLGKAELNERVSA